MPRKYVRKGRKRVPRKYRRSYSTRGYTPRSIIPVNGFAKTMLARMKYVESVIINPDAITPSLYEFRANSIYDPNKTGVGTQPRAHDLFAQVYNHYNVIGSKITVRCNPSTSTATVPLIWGVSTNTTADQFVGLNRDDIIESSNASIRRYRTAGGNASFGNGGNAVQSASFSARKQYGLKKGQVATYNPNSSVFGANPSRDPMFTIYAMHTASADPNPQEFTVQIDYLVLLSERDVLPLS